MGYNSPLPLSAGRHAAGDLLVSIQAAVHPVSQMAVVMVIQQWVSELSSFLTAHQHIQQTSDTDVTVD